MPVTGLALAAACGSDERAPQTQETLLPGETQPAGGGEGSESGSEGDSSPEQPTTTLGEGGFRVDEGLSAFESESGDSESDGRGCLGETRQAEAIGLDIFLMLDTSGSMLVPLPGGEAVNLTKWDAVRQSLEIFSQDAETAEIGIGLQYFPRFEGVDSPVCTSNDDCTTASGPCSNSFCLNEPFAGVLAPANDPLQACGQDADCADTGAQCRPLTAFCFDSAGTALGGCDPGDPNACTGLAQAANVTAQCEEVGICEGDPLVLCSATAPCPALLGSCLPLINACLGSQLECGAADYATPAVAISSEADRSVEIVSSLGRQQPFGLTPTGPALAGALEHAQTWALDHPDRQVLTVLATDGFPTECAPQAIPDIAQIAFNANSGQRPVRTFVIGVFGEEDLGFDGQARLDALARAGGTNQAVVIDADSGDVAQEFLTALNRIRDTAVGCEFQLTSEQALDFAQVNLNVTEPNGTNTDLFNVASELECGSDDGWYYVLDADGSPTQINVCPTTCDTFGSGGVRVDLQVGCATRIR